MPLDPPARPLAATHASTTGTSTGPRRSRLVLAGDAALALTIAILAMGVRLAASADRRLRCAPPARCVCGLHPPLCTGDVLLFSSDRPAIRYSLQCMWNHVGVAVVSPADGATLGTHAGETLLWESNVAWGGLTRRDGDAPVDRLTGEVRDGTQLIDLRAKVGRYPGRVCVRRLRAPTVAAEAARHPRVAAGVCREAGRPFEDRSAFLAWIGLHAWRLVPVPPPAALRSRRGVFCSELAAIALRDAGALRDDVDPARVLPRHLADGRAASHLLCDGWTLGDMEPLVPCAALHR